MTPHKQRAGANWTAAGDTEVRADHRSNSKNTLGMTPNGPGNGRNEFHVFILVGSDPWIMHIGLVSEKNGASNDDATGDTVNTCRTAHGYSF
jgi:hypothetical protein